MLSHVEVFPSFSGQPNIALCVCNIFLHLYLRGYFHLHFWGKCCNEHQSIELMLSAITVSPKECEETVGGGRYASDCSDSIVSISMSKITSCTH